MLVGTGGWTQQLTHIGTDRTGHLMLLDPETDTEITLVVAWRHPVVTDSIVGAVFLVSLATARPVVARVAADFYPMSQDVAKSPRVQRLFWHLTLLWATVCLGKAVVTLWLLHSLPLVSFVVVKSTVLLVLTVSAVTATVSAATWVARREGLLHTTPTG